MEAIVNRVAASGLISMDLEDYLPQGERVVYDIKENLYEGLILREKEFRDYVKQNDWTTYKGKHVAITCSTEAIIPTWAYMLIVSKLESFAETIVFGGMSTLNDHLIKQAIEQINPDDFVDRKVVVKGCSDIETSASIYMSLTQKLLPVVASLMFGEPCSTVPIYKKPKN